MKKFEVFESVESCIIGSNSEECSMFSAICDDDGYFTLSGKGYCGVEGLKKIVYALEDIIREKENEK